MSNATRVSSEVLEGIMVVRNSGALNMFDIVGVIKMAESLGYEQSAEWMRSHRAEYANGIFNGFIIEDDSKPCLVS